jgi:hypothetical protein
MATNNTTDDFPKKHIMINLDKNFKNNYIKNNLHKKNYGNRINNYDNHFGYYIYHTDFNSNKNYIYTEKFPYYILNSNYYFDISEYLEALRLQGKYLKPEDIQMIEPSHKYVHSKSTSSSFFDYFFN